MDIISIIEHKRDMIELTQEEIQYFIDGVTHGTIENYQISALLMAIVLNGMSLEETTHLTHSMLKSGDVIDLSQIEGKKVDKHSTGGVGDKTTLILSPLVAAAGAKVAKMSGRGLGHTGGTLDKLESIPGYHIEIESQAFIDQVNRIGVAVIGQTGNLVYADKVLYALRDVTGTVQSIPLIAASIMSKKLAGGADCILLDVKYGDGAFMKTVDDAKALASVMTHIGTSLGREVTCMITNMNQPLGHAIGNALEVKEAIETLTNQGPHALETLCVEAAGIMLYQAGLADSHEHGAEVALETLRSGAAYEKFLEWISAQDGDVTVFEDLAAFGAAPYSVEIKANTSGYVHLIKAEDLGLVSMHLGAGRKTVNDIIDMKAGILITCDVGDAIEKGHVLCVLQSSQPIDAKEIKEAQACFVIDTTKTDKPVMIEAVI